MRSRRCSAKSSVSGSLEERRIPVWGMDEVHPWGRVEGHDQDARPCRQHATEEAEAKRADAIVAFRFDTSELGGARRGQ